MKKSSFEQSLASLQEKVEQLESGELTLEQALQAFEQGIGHTRACQQALEQAEKRIQILLERDGQPQEQDFTAIAQDKPSNKTDSIAQNEEIPF